MEFTAEEMATEEWRDIVGYEGRYQVSNLGRYSEIGLLKSGIMKHHKVARLVALSFIPNPEDKPCIDHIDTVRNNDRMSNLRWVTNSENMRNPITYAKCCKLAQKRNLGRKTSDKTKQILRELNLGSGGEKSAFGTKWSEETRQKHFENIKNGGRKHTEESLQKMRDYKASETHLRKAVKPVTQYTKDGVKVRDWLCAKYAGVELGINISCITQVVLGKKKSCGGFIWRYAENPQEVLDEFFKNR